MPTTLTTIPSAYPSNRYAGTCRTCHSEVPAGEGRIRHGADGWIIAHLVDSCPTTDAPHVPEPAELHRSVRPRGADGRFTKF